jgi:predicted ABC-type ATPase
MSHPDRVNLLRDARRAGYRTYLYFVCTDSPIINAARIENRVKRGGHDVPADKVRERYARTLSLLGEAIRNSSRAYLFDNSGRQHVLVAEFEEGRARHVARDVPSWLAKNVSADLLKPR